MNGALATHWPWAVRSAVGNMIAPEQEMTGTAEEIARQAQTGSAPAFEQLVAMHEARIFNYLRQMTSNLHDAQDLTQVTFVKAYRNLTRYDARHSFASWLFTIAKRTALNHFRDTRRTEELDERTLVETHTPAAQVEHHDEEESVWAKARRLPRDQFEALWLRYAEGFSIEETARAMGTNQVRVRVLLHRGRGRLAKLLKNRNP
jgi:RNA polymerase sigma-70 factor, ECF subfamily